MFKRIACASLVLCLLAPSALAEGHPTVHVVGSFYEEYWKESGIEIVGSNYQWIRGLALMQLDNPPDLYSTSSNDCNIQALKDAGVLADLSDSEVLQEAVSRMRPEIQELLTDDEGRLVVMAKDVVSNPVYWQQDAWDAAGLTQADVPQSYSELLDFAEMWAARIQKHPEKNVCFTDTRLFGGNASYCYVRWFMDMLINTWEMQAYEAGEPLNFNTPEFIALLERTRSVGKLLRKAEPSQKKRQQMLSLFWSQNGGSAIYGLYNGGREYGLSHALPFRITDDQPVLMRAYASVNMVHAGSESMDALIGYLERYIPSDKDVYSVELYKEGVTPGAYGTDFIERITAGWINDRNDYTGKFSFAPMRTFFLYEGSLMKFIKGELSAEKLAKKISEAKTDPNK
ncbi:MAG: ABC transporter substrate-binding protein [Eubacteriales bacterium]|nr:ABC transporter substrate-binding protein [Eubacteriales bacterium]